MRLKWISGCGEVSECSADLGRLINLDSQEGWRREFALAVTFESTGNENAGIALSPCRSSIEKGAVLTAKFRLLRDWTVGDRARAVGSMTGLVRKGGLEPPRIAPPDPKSGASANFATFALLQSTAYALAFRLCPL